MLGGGGRKTQGQAGPSDCSLGKCQVRSDRHSSEMSSAQCSKEAKTAEIRQNKLGSKNKNTFICIIP